MTHESGHDHHEQHQVAWEDFVRQLRENARRYYLEDFDWRGEPIPEDFDGPRYYPIDPGWRVVARLDRETRGAGEEVELATSTGQLRRMVRVGQVVFDPGDGEVRLTVFHPAGATGDDPLFIPFQDATSGTETYGAGRYLDAFLEDDDTVELDFNLAYSPSCAYSPRYDCPYPPPGNRLPIPVRAGEVAPFAHA
jgi:uncharacterized protein